MAVGPLGRRTLRSCERILGVRASCPLLVPSLLGLLPGAKSGQDARAPRNCSRVLNPNPKNDCPRLFVSHAQVLLSRSSRWTVFDTGSGLDGPSHRVVSLLRTLRRESLTPALLCESRTPSPGLSFVEARSSSRTPNPESRTPALSEPRELYGTTQSLSRTISYGSISLPMQKLRSVRGAAEPCTFREPWLG